MWVVRCRCGHASETFSDEVRTWILRHGNTYACGACRTWLLFDESIRPAFELPRIPVAMFGAWEGYA